MSGTSHRNRLLGVPHWARPDHPIYRLETRRRASRGILALLRLGCLPTTFSLTGLSILIIIVLVSPGRYWWGGYWDWFENVAIQSLLWALFAVAVIQILAGAITNILIIAQTTPMISGEVELRSWGLLRTTTLLLREILFAKLAAAITRLRTQFVGLMILRAISLVTGILLLAYAVVRETVFYSSRAEVREFWAAGYWLPVLLASVPLLAYYVGQPAIQFVLNGALGLLASAYARSRSRAIAAGLSARLVMWIAVILLNVGAMIGLGTLFVNWTDPYYAQIEVFHGMQEPTQGQIVWAICLMGGGYAVAVLAGQIGFILAALGLTQRRIRHLGS